MTSRVSPRTVALGKLPARRACWTARLILGTRLCSSYCIPAEGTSYTPWAIQSPIQRLKKIISQQLSHPLFNTIMMADLSDPQNSADDQTKPQVYVEDTANDIPTLSSFPPDNQVVLILVGLIGSGKVLPCPHRHEVWLY